MRAGRVGFGADLAHDQHPVLGPQRLADQLVDEAGAVELGGVHVVDAEFEQAAQQCDGRAAVPAQAWQLHRAEADAGDGVGAEAAGAPGAGHSGDRGRGGADGKVTGHRRTPAHGRETEHPPFRRL
ncbi:hypothetical protein GCM10023336_41150 [Streptomyces similanensis]|uniref:Uncharacterized protein n=1 Tax=Streptomyces similanensis TaxID=1274988 RepID=A0ABP9KRW0_9ACTN